MSAHGASPGPPPGAPAAVRAAFAPGRVARVGWFDLNRRAAWARASVRIRAAWREPAWIVTDGLLPALGMYAYVLLYRALGAPPAYETIAVIGGVLSVYWLGVLWNMGAQLFWEKQQGQLQIYFAAPCSRMAVLTGMAAGGLVMTSVRAVVTFAVGFGILGVRVEPFDGGLLALVFVITMAALYALGMLLASLFLLHGREAWHLCTSLEESVFFLSGLYFPLRTLGAFGAFVGGLVPLALGVDAMRQVLLHEAARGLFPIGIEVAALAVMAVLLFVAAQRAMHHLEGLAKREGRLTQRWQ